MVEENNGKMIVTKTSIEGLVKIEYPVFSDDRGSFAETFQAQKFKELVADVQFVQDNQSISHKGVVRGLHFQTPPMAQGKLVRVSRGRALDVAVDIRKNSPTYGKWETFDLTAENGLQVFIPRGFAHGFVSLEDKTIFQYKCDNYYSKEHEDSLLWNDEALKIDWQIDTPIVSEKDALAGLFKDFDSPFV